MENKMTECMHEEVATIEDFKNEIEELTYIIDYIIKENSEDQNASLLHDAIINGNVIVLETLIKHGVDINLQFDNSKITPIELAIKHNRKEIAKILSEHGATYDGEILMDDSSSDSITA